ncbi:sialic acid-binding Ig-like lectin 12 isoform X1 [Chanodichthys erythropterus]|uniref:sialic acid-binding Ig-like lectin 12 isoform X1 n=1 Tax=Chanodichthys erythropterus TaxID=933992 RepID=UPI00351DCAD6
MDIWTAEKILLLSFLMKGVLCRDFSISLPEKIEALSGSCVIINCTFEIRETFDKNLTENATGCWHKDGTEKIVFNSSMSSQNSIIKGNITGILQKKDCTSIFYDIRSNYSGTYYFRIEGEGGLKWTYSEAHVLIDVIESPPKPTVKLYVVQDQEEVLEGSSVSLHCSAETLCSSPPPTLTWSSTPRIPLSESSRQQELISDLNFTAAHSHHRVTFTCTITYQILDKNKTAQDNITLHVQYAPKISPSSSCNGTDVTECFCEVDGNPSPELEWHLSGRPVTNSSDTFISEERLRSTVLRSSITLHQSLTHTSLQCVGNNTRGTARKLFQLYPFPTKRGQHLLPILIGVAVGVFLMMMLCIIIYCARRKNSRSLPTKQEDTIGIIMTDKDIQQEGESESVYANNVMLSPAEAATLNRQESLHYASIDFKNIKPESEEIRGVSSLTTDYAVICYSGKVRKTKGSVGGDQPNSNVSALKSQKD